MRDRVMNKCRSEKENNSMIKRIAEYNQQEKGNWFASKKKHYYFFTSNSKPIQSSHQKTEKIESDQIICMFDVYYTQKFLTLIGNQLANP